VRRRAAAWPSLVLSGRVRCSPSPFFSIFTSCRGLLRSVRAVSAHIQQYQYEDTDIAVSRHMHTRPADKYAMQRLVHTS